MHVRSSARLSAMSAGHPTPGLHVIWPLCKTTSKARSIFIRRSVGLLAAHPFDRAHMSTVPDNTGCVCLVSTLAAQGRPADTSSRHQQRRLQPRLPCQQHSASCKVPQAGTSSDASSCARSASSFSRAAAVGAADAALTELRRPSLHRASTLAGSSLNSRRMTVLLLSRSVLLCMGCGSSAQSDQSAQKKDSSSTKVVQPNLAPGAGHWYPLHCPVLRSSFE